MRLIHLLAVAALTLRATDAASQPQAKWINTTHSFGAFDEDMGSVTTYFKVVNTGDKPLSILSVRASCGCTSPTYSHKPVAPGDTGQVAVTYNPAGRPGKFDKKVRVETNTTPATTTLTIKGVVIGDRQTLRAHYPVDLGVLKLKNTVVQFGEVTKGRTKTAFLDGYNQSADTIRPSLTGLPPFVVADIAPKAVPPGEQVTFTFFYDSSKAKEQWGLSTSEVVLSPDKSSSQKKPVSLVAIVNEDFSKLTPEQREKAPKAAYSTATIDLGRISRDDKVHAELFIDNFGKEQLVIRRISCPDEFITVKCSKDKVKPGSRAKVDITVDADAIPASSSLVNSRLTIITNDPTRPSSPIRIVAELPITE
ncbi:DUF1573 domain-containing protein [uncultured Muribaculum sp.]|uniref:DUF1573 domain-containing protein n=1 Tax=uncultured Muribaculum sp. TaxID=1918613 RepID=UPI0025E44A5D|nr:DUF1573 domain-containing protein [uncultured Muribaculum sp.]